MNKKQIFMKRIKFDDLLKEWLETQRNQVKESTFTTYYNHIQKHILPYFTNELINSITQDKIQVFIKYQINQGRLDGKGGLSTKTVKELVSVIKLCFKYAVNRNYIKTFNLDCKFPKQKKYIKMFNIDEYTKLIEYLKTEQSYASIGIMMILCTGIRIGELCALKNKDINIEKKELHICKTLQRIQDLENESTKIIITSAKTICSDRIIPIPNALLSYLEIGKNDDYFLTQDKQYIEPRSLRYHFKSIIKKLHLTEVTVHSLRHYFATQCIELGFDYNCLSEILGHSSPTTTMNLYVHSKDTYKQTCMNKIVI